MARILIVDDDKDVVRMIEELMSFEHNSTESAYDGDQALTLLALSGFDLIILDWQLPDASGVEILRKIRSRGNTTPVIMLTGKKELVNKVEGFESGADDYLTKPFHVKELSVRIKALLRRGYEHKSDILKAGYLAVDPGQHKVYKNGEELHLLPKEFALLEFFIRNSNNVFSVDALLARVWGSTAEASPDTVRTTIKRLRDRIDIEGQESMVKTVHRVGYRFEVPAD